MNKTYLQTLMKGVLATMNIYPHAWIKVSNPSAKFGDMEAAIWTNEGPQHPIAGGLIGMLFLGGHIDHPAGDRERYVLTEQGRRIGAEFEQELLAEKAARELRN